MSRPLPGSPKGTGDLSRCKVKKVVMFTLREAQAVLITQVLVQMAAGVK